MANKEFLKSIAKKTIKISEERNYLYKNNKIQLSNMGKTEYYDAKYNYKKAIENAEIFDTTIFEVLNESTISAIIRNSYDKNLGVLNFASARHAGGGFINGALAQEECLAYCSDLYLTQITDTGKKYYYNNNACSHHSYYNGMMMTENYFFRDTSFELIENPIYCSILTAPAVNMGMVKKYGEPEKSAQHTMKNRMRNILYLFIQYRCSNIILGAFGCGVFKNSPEDVAKYWYELLVEENLQKYFKKITFSVLDSSGKNIQPFKKYFLK